MASILLRFSVIAAAIAAAAALAACSGNRLGNPFAAGGGAASAPPQPQIEMDGRWLLSTPNFPSCGMRFGGVRNASEGTIAPEGGCPGNFFTSRRWTFEDGALVVKNHKSETLAHLTFAGGRFEGSATGGMPVTLSR